MPPCSKSDAVILTRPAVEAGERLGFLPGDMFEKVNPYLRPLYDALYDMLDIDRARKLIERGLIEIAPIAFMRGRTLNDSFIILDEAQNTTAEQMKMFLTRLGYNSQAVVTGDITQIDLPADRTSGLKQVQTILKDIEGIKFVYFSKKRCGPAISLFDIVEVMIAPMLARKSFCPVNRRKNVFFEDIVGKQWMYSLAIYKIKFR